MTKVSCIAIKLKLSRGTFSSITIELKIDGQSANCSSCTTTEPSKLLTSCITAIKNHLIKYCETVYERSGKNLLWSIKSSGEVLHKLKFRCFCAASYYITA